MPTPTNPATSWLDIIPPIPLARAVPVVVVHDTHPGRSFRAVTLHAARGEWNVHDGNRDGFVPEHMLRPDLDDPQGFAYAARYHYQQISHPNIAEVPMPPAQREAQLRVLAWLVGDVTDADRLALATALAEVSR